ncbi:MAG: DegQ family serine endoprotease [Desulfotignum sp.]|nr:DegQ family serine endoprotease [Desulfotignum sp.]MCF8113208.1 DegQ family serine endoprotease [Desulfotignum sp.]MCF8125444.1 DegQ family serine endoprotease [Desulfotignum sp.]
MKQIRQMNVFLVILVISFFMPLLPAQAAKKNQMIPASFSILAQQARPGVVNIQTVKTVQGGGRVFEHFFGQPFGNREGLEEFFAPFFNQQPQSRKEQSLGSGFIISRDGYIVTNNHVIKDADQIKVILHDKQEYDARIVGTDPMTDLALIKVDAKNLQPLKFGKSGEADIGSWVVAIGSPFGLEQTVTAGIISAKGRILGSGPYDDFIQTDASINPGNSGGPLLNMDGEVIGINTAIVRSGQGIGFAIPSDLATGIIDQLIETQQVSRGWMGVAIQNITPELAEYYGIKDTGGVYVAKVYEGNPAHEAGIEPGDVIISVNGEKIETSRDLTITIANLKVDETVDVKIIRDGSEKTVKVKLGKRPDQDPEVLASTDEFDSFGFKFKALDAAMARHLGYPAGIKGLVVTEIKQDSPAQKSGVRPGDLLMELNRQHITSLEEYHTLLDRIEKGKTAQLLFRRGNSHVYVVRFEK